MNTIRRWPDLLGCFIFAALASYHIVQSDLLAALFFLWCLVWWGRYFLLRWL